MVRPTVLTKDHKKKKENEPPHAAVVAAKTQSTWEESGAKN
jgi:hypothetical protein